MQKLTVHKSVKLEDGKHEGKIVEIVAREVHINGKPVTYLDVCIEERESELILRYSVSPYISEKSKLGRLLANFGIDMTPGKEYDPEAVLKDKEVTFLTLLKKNDNGKEYAEIAEDSIKPLIIEEAVVSQQ